MKIEMNANIEKSIKLYESYKVKEYKRLKEILLDYKNRDYNVDEVNQNFEVADI